MRLTQGDCENNAPWSNEQVELSEWPSSRSRQRRKSRSFGSSALLLFWCSRSGGRFWILFATRVLIVGLLALSFDLVWGYAGILCFGQALFFGMAGYSCALLATKLGVTSILVMLPLGARVGFVVVRSSPSW